MEAKVNSYLFRGTRIMAKTKSAIIYRFKLAKNKKNYAMIIEVKEIK